MVSPQDDTLARPSQDGATEPMIEARGLVKRDGAVTVASGGVPAVGPWETVPVAAA